MAPSRTDRSDTLPAAGDSAESAELIELEPDRFALTGTLDLGAVTRLAKQGRRLIRSDRPQYPSLGRDRIEIDLGGVGRSSSAAIALLLEWVDLAAQNRIELRFCNWPTALVRIAAFSNVDDVLGIDASSAVDGITQTI